MVLCVNSVLAPSASSSSVSVGHVCSPSMGSTSASACKLSLDFGSAFMSIRTGASPSPPSCEKHELSQHLHLLWEHKRVLHSCVYLNLLKHLAWITHYNQYHHSCIVDYFCMVKQLKVHTCLRSMNYWFKVSFKLPVFTEWKRTGKVRKLTMTSMHKIVLNNVSVKVNSR